MAKRQYIGNAPRVAQVDRIYIDAQQYSTRHIAEGSKLIVTIAEKSLFGQVPIHEADANDFVGPWTASDDANAANALLTSLKAAWESTTIPEFMELNCSTPNQDDNGDWFVDISAKVPGVPFEIDVSSPDPVIDVDTLRNGAVGVDAEFTFVIDDVAEGGNFIIQWDLGSGVETSALIPFPVPELVALKTAIVAGMASIGPDDLDVTVAGGVYTLKLKGALASTTVEPPILITTDLIGGGEVFSATIRDGNSGTVTDSFSGSSSHYLSTHTANTGQGWTVSGTHASWLYVHLGKLKAGLAYVSGSYVMAHTSLALSNYVGVTDALLSIKAEWNVEQWWMNHQSNGDLGDGQYSNVLAGASGLGGTASIRLHTRYASANDTIYMEVSIDPADNGGRAARATTPPNVTGPSGTMTVAIKKVVGGVTTTIATTTVDRNFATWRYDGSNHVFADQHGNFSSHYGTLIAPLDDTNMTFDLKEVGGTVTGHVIDATGAITTTVTGALSTFTGTGVSYGLEFIVNSQQESITSLNGGPWMDDFSILDANDPDERQSLWTNGHGGTFTASDADETETATDIPAGASRSELEDKLEEIYGVGGISVYDGSGTADDPWLLRFIGANAATNMGQIKGDGTNLTGIATAEVTTIELGTPGVTEQWSVAIVGATSGTFILAIRDKRTTALTYGANAATVEAALEALPNIAAGQVDVTGAGSNADPYIITLGDDWEAVDVRQMTAFADGLVGTGYPAFELTRIAESRGPWHWNDPYNWINVDTGLIGLPVTGDTLIFANGETNRCPKYDLDQSAITVPEIQIYASFDAGAIIGLPQWNALGYREYRLTELIIGMSGAGQITIGGKFGGGSTMLNINTLATETHLRVLMTSSPVSGEDGALQWHGTNVNNTLEHISGYTSVAPYAGQYATLASLIERNGIVRCGHGTTLGPVDRTGGELYTDRVAHTGVLDLQG